MSAASDMPRSFLEDVDIWNGDIRDLVVRNVNDVERPQIVSGVSDTNECLNVHRGESGLDLSSAGVQMLAIMSFQHVFELIPHRSVELMILSSEKCCGKQSKIVLAR